MAATPPDPAELDRLATRLEQAALQFETIGIRQVSRSQGLQWTCRAATTFVDNMTNFEHATGQASGALHDLAAGLRTGANSIRDAQSKK